MVLAVEMDGSLNTLRYRPEFANRVDACPTSFITQRIRAHPFFKTMLDFRASRQARS